MEERVKEILLKLHRRKMYLDDACKELEISPMRLSKLYRANIENVLAELAEESLEEVDVAFDISDEARQLVDKAILEDDMPVIMGNDFKFAFELATVLLGDAELVNISEDGELDIDGPINIIGSEKIVEVESDYYAMLLKPKFEDSTVILNKDCIVLLGE